MPQLRYLTWISFQVMSFCLWCLLSSASQCERKIGKKDINLLCLSFFPSFIDLRNIMIEITLIPKLICSTSLCSDLLLFAWFYSILKDWAFQLFLQLVQMQQLSIIHQMQKHVWNLMQIASTYLTLEHRSLATLHSFPQLIFFLVLLFSGMCLHCNLYFYWVSSLTGPCGFEVSRWNNWYYTDCSFWQAFCTWESMLYCCRWTLLLSFWFKIPCSSSFLLMSAFSLTHVCVD